MLKSEFVPFSQENRVNKFTLYWTSFRLNVGVGSAGRVSHYFQLLHMHVYLEEVAKWRKLAPFEQLETGAVIFVFLYIEDQL